MPAHAAQVPPGGPVFRRAVAAAAGSVLGASLLAGCGMLLPQPAPPDREAAWRAHASDLSRFRSWTLHGNLVVRSGGEASQVAIRWRQSHDSYFLRLTAPFGAGVLEIEGSAAGVEARFADGRRARAASPEALLEHEIGWSMPLEALRYWMVGAVAPGGAPARIDLDGRGRLAHLEQAGWTIVYDRYGGLPGLALPDRIRFSNASITAAVAVRRWTAGN